MIDSSACSHGPIEKAHQESEALYRRLFESNPIPMWVYDLETLAFLAVNDATTEQYGYSRDEFLRMTICEIRPAEEVPRLLGDIAKERIGIDRAGIWRHLTRDGRVIHVDITSHSLDHEGRRARLVLAQDVTESVRAEEELRDAKERLQRAVTAGHVGLWDLDLRDRTVYFSEEWKSQIGYDPHELVDAFETWEQLLHPDDRERVMNGLKRFFDNPAPRYEHEFRLRHKDGSYRRILSQSSVTFDPSGEPLRMVGAHVDITERAQLEEQFYHAQKMESVGRLAAGIAHDFNNLLMVIMSYAEVAATRLGASHPQREELGHIQHAATRAAELTGKLLTFSRKQVVQKEAIDLNTLLGDFQKLLRQALNEDVTIEFQPGDDLGCIQADPGQMEQVVMNLAVNARDAMTGGGTLRVSTSNVVVSDEDSRRNPQLHPGCWVRLRISDTGAGIEPGVLAHIFEPFFTTKDTGKGTGLGLSTVYAIIGDAAGIIEAQSRLGEGTTFTMHFPRCEEQPRPSKPFPTAGVSGGSETVLVVEDEKPILDLVSLVLSSAGYRVLAAQSAHDALEIVQAGDSPVHLALLDVVMPGMSGREAAERIRACRPGVRIAHMSGYMDDEILRRGVATNSVHYLRKPMASEELLRGVREALDCRGFDCCGASADA